MRIATALILVLGLTGCRRTEYVVVRAPLQSLVDYGQWDVPMPVVAPEFLMQAAYPPADWAAMVDMELKEIKKQIAAKLTRHQNVGRPMRVLISVERLVPPKEDFFPDFIIRATFVDGASEAVICSVTANTATYPRNFGTEGSSSSCRLSDLITDFVCRYSY